FNHGWEPSDLPIGVNKKISPSSSDFDPKKFTIQQQYRTGDTACQNPTNSRQRFYSNSTSEP
ncbi:hypothetical protein OAE56_02105, partial [Verrucomicrobiales bacterium]|nr:hypothetical protein [Verrucomicrobiales bacterium]